ncbi:calcium/sodium antiporter [Alkalibacter saccharofermentans]|uniref:Cation:H+ antiporter n=1 Tax=Alkalibacter saccharofermentans DSM 14828 TaxID=1120975 RepID=A0A1M4XZB4_9FIRM|nr:calcium/sodium antiporter [Alkalibacter saccharofermentans]SHE98768.1 cation:H+ antiporter [Alkalibacter saccharofermentans DSM 14828]
MEELIHGYLISLPTLLLAAIIVVSLGVLSKGADVLVDEAVILSFKWGVPKMIIGATIISLGTTLPEASVSVLAAMQGNADLALGNAIGSIIADTGLIIGLASLLGHLPIEKLVVERQGKIQLGAGILLAVVCLPFLSPGEGGNISRMVGILFLVLLGLYIYYSIKWSKITDALGPGDEDGIEITKEADGSVLLLIGKIFAAIAMVILSSKVLISSVEITAVRVGIPQSVIAATLIAFGTSLPELITAVNAVRKGHGELAVGNIVGADILNVLFVVGSAAAVTPGGLVVPSNYFKLQIPAMVIILLVFRFFTKKRGDSITKPEGIVLLGMYFVYLALNYLWI